MTTIPSALDMHGLVLDEAPDGYVYAGTFRDAGAVWRAKKSGGAPTLLYYMNDGGECGWLSRDATHLYFTEYSDHDSPPSRGVYQMALDGSGVKEVTTNGYLGMSVVTSDADYIYFLNDYDNLGIGRIPKTGGPVEPLLSYEGTAPFFNLGGGLIVDDGWLYFGGAAGITRMHTDGTGAQALSTTHGSAVLAVQDGMVYWSEFDGFLYRAPKDGSGSPSQFLAADAVPLTFHGKYGYAHRGSNIIRFDTTAAFPAAEFVWFGENPWPMASDKVSLWWIEHYQARVMRLAF